MKQMRENSSSVMVRSGYVRVHNQVRTCVIMLIKITNMYTHEMGNIE